MDLKSKRIMKRFAEYLSQREGLTVERLLQDFVKERDVKMRNHSKTVMTIDSEDFFAVLADIGVRKSESVHDNLEELFSIDLKYRDCMLLRKIVKTTQLFQENTYLKSSTMKKTQWKRR